MSWPYLATGIFTHSLRQNYFSFLFDVFRLWTAIFKSDTFLIGLRYVLWLGHSNIFKGFSLNTWVLLLQYATGHCPPGRLTSVPVCNHSRLKQVLLKNVPILSTIHLFPWTQIRLPVPAPEKHTHGVMGQVRFAPDIAFALLAKKVNFSLISPEDLHPYILGVAYIAFGKLKTFLPILNIKHIYPYPCICTCQFPDFNFFC